MQNRTIASLALGTVLAVAVTAAGASEDPIKTRQNLMKSNGASAGAVGKMIKGEMPYDPVTAELALRVIHATAVGLPDLFPEGSDTGETEAAPKIWTDKAGFDKIAAEMETAALEAIPAAKGGLDGLKGAFGEVAKNCKGCHESYRVEKKN